MSLTFARFLEVSGGRFIADAATLPADFRPSTDSRTVQRGDVFLCLRGPDFDGHDFIAAAIERGAAAIVVDDDAKVPRPAAVPIVRVADAKAAYLAGATAARRAFGGQIIAITGSTGKTTTKEFAAQLIGRRRRVIASHANENNELGVAKLCYRLGADVDLAVVEFGARHPGEIAELVEIAAPEIGILTNIGEAHLEFFKDQDELARTKFALFGRGARPVCNAGDAWSRMLTAEAKLDAATLWTRLVGDPMMAGIMLEAGVPRDDQIAVTFGASHAFAQWRLPGEHNVRDALLAAGGAILAGLSFEETVEAFGDLRLPPGRFERHTLPGGAAVIYDAYNASPASMLQALQTFSAIGAVRHIAVLGSMAELGRDAIQHHRAVGAAAARCAVDALYCGGEFADEIARGATGAGMPAANVSTFADNREISDRLRRSLVAGDCVLLKGSRVQKMEEILNGLIAPGMLAS
jgi:UDP-N-acetylmuramoyl-tripeptide--D-alanyl-D-alanine ligase